MAKAGDLDKSFGNQGLLVTNIPGSGTWNSDSGYYSNFNVVYSLAEQSDKKIIATGTVYDVTSSIYYLALIRYDLYGFVDTTFGKSGLVKTQFKSNTYNQGYSIALQNDGKIVVGGQTASANGTSYFGLVRYNKDGTLDEGFGLNGLVTTLISTDDTNDFINTIKIDTNGNIIVGGGSNIILSVTDNNHSYFTIARYTKNGILDNTFGDIDTNSTMASPNNKLGYVTPVFTSYDEFSYITSITLDSSNNIFCSGTIQKPDSNFYFALVKYTSGGVLDTTFGDPNGATKTGSAELNNVTYEISSIILDSNNNIICGGIDNNNNNDFILLRYTSNGVLDTTFGTNGKVTTDINSGSADNLNSIAIDKNNKIICVGKSNNSNAIARYTSTGVLDTTFGTNGIVTTSFSNNSIDQAYSVIIQPEDNKIVIGGYDLYNNTNKISGFGLARYIN